MTCLCQWAVAEATVTHVRAAQRPGTELVDIDYDLTGGQPPFTVRVRVSSDDGKTFSVPARMFSGAFGAGLEAGVNLRVTWNAGADWNGRLSAKTRFKVIATDQSVPPVIPGFVQIPDGAFTMGHDTGNPYDEAAPVTASLSAFLIGTHEVTLAEWDAVRTVALGSGYDLPAGSGKSADHPVHGVSWHDIVKWCNARSQRDGLTPCYRVGGAIYQAGDADEITCDWNADGYRLPTESEWEKAARGGVEGADYPWGGATISHAQANYYAYGSDYGSQSGDAEYHPDYNDGIFPYTSPVGSFPANGYGLFDMAGNVYERCWDFYADGYYVDPAFNPHGPDHGDDEYGGDRIIRGGSWNGDARGANVWARASSSVDAANPHTGFRLVRSVTGDPISKATRVDTRRLDGILPVITKLRTSRSDGRLLVWRQSPEFSLDRQAAGSSKFYVDHYFSLEVPEFTTAGWESGKRGLGTFYGLSLLASGNRKHDQAAMWVGDSDAPIIGHDDDDWDPVGFGFNETSLLVMEPGTYYFRVRLRRADAPDLKLRARFESARFFNAPGEPVDLLRTDSAAGPLWLVLHGRNDSQGGCRRMADALANGVDGRQQVVCVDWAGGADAGGSASHGRLVMSLARNLAAVLRKHGFKPREVNGVGHSWGALLGCQTARYLGGFNRFVVLEPSTHPLPGFDESRVNFKKVSVTSTGVKSGPPEKGTAGTARTCDFAIRLVSESHSGDQAGSAFHTALTKAWFTRAMNAREPDTYWPYLRDLLLRQDQRPVVPWLGIKPGGLGGYDLQDHGRTSYDQSSGTARFVLHHYLLYQDPGGGRWEARQWPDYHWDVRRH